MFFQRKRIAKEQKRLDSGPVPVHIGIIMDGNGRWAQKQGLPRKAGHWAGMNAINRCIDGLKTIDVKYLTLFAFSTENWRRPKAEVDYLMNLPAQFVARELDNLIANNIRLRIIGDMDGLPEHTQKAVANGIKATTENTGLTLSFAINYGAREEIIRAVRQVGLDCKRGLLDPKEIDGPAFEQYLYTTGMPNPDLIIRTSGEVRISNFLLWQIAYSELCFIDTLWPDFSEQDLYRTIADFQQRQRRYGGI
jgi:undecaprenyl diphosphate synthase